MSEIIEKELSWDDTIENDGADFIILDPGEYNFQITGFERSRTKGGGKLPPCNMAIIKLTIESPKGKVEVQERLILHTSLEWKLSEFFTSISQKEKGEAVKMNWNKVPGAKGRCKIKHRIYNGNTYNEVDKFLAPEEKTYAPGTF